MQILIIEDEKRLADALGQIMQEARYQADIVYDGRDGLAYASSGDYDVIVDGGTLGASLAASTASFCHAPS